MTTDQALENGFTHIAHWPTGEHRDQFVRLNRATGRYEIDSHVAIRVESINQGSVVIKPIQRH